MTGRQSVPLDSSTNITLSNLVEALADDIEVTTTSEVHPTDGRIIKDPADGTVYIGDGDAFQDVSSAVGVDVPSYNTEQQSFTPTTVSSDTTVTDATLILVDTSGGAVTVTLGSSLLEAGKVVSILDNAGSASSNSITVNTEGSESIEPGGASSKTISVDWAELSLVGDDTASNWRAINRNVDQESTTTDDADIGQLIAALDAAGYDIDGLGGLFTADQPNVDLSSVKSAVTTDGFARDWTSFLSPPWSSVTNNNGESFTNSPLRITTGTNSGGSSIRFSRNVGLSPVISNGFNFDFDRWIRATVNFEDTSGPLHYCTGAVTRNDKTTQHIGVAMKGGDLVASVADGSNVDESNTLISGASTGARRVLIEYTSGTDIVYTIDGSTTTLTLSDLSNLSSLPSGGSQASQLTMFFAESSDTTERSLECSHARMAQSL